MRKAALGAMVAVTLVLAPGAWGQQSPPQRDTLNAVPGDTVRANLQARVRQRLAAVVRQRLNLTDDQMRQLTAVNAGYEGRRRALLSEERNARMSVRAELQRGQGADQKRVEAALADLFRVQRARIDLAEQEQRQLAKFLQPSQRAGYLALQEQLRRRVDEMRQRRGNPAGLRGPRPGAPPSAPR